MDNEYILERDTDSQQVMQLLEEKIYEHNSTAIHKDDGQYFSWIARDHDRNIIAGIAGWTWAGACEIMQLWVDEKSRKHGIGKRLLAAAEEEAREKGCRQILVRSYGFQSPGFYEKNGYTLLCTINDFPPGHDYYFLTKKPG